MKSANKFINNFNKSIFLSGSWTIINMNLLNQEIIKITSNRQKNLIVDCKGIENLDTAGSILLLKLLKLLKKFNNDYKLVNLNSNKRLLLNKVDLLKKEKLHIPSVYEHDAASSLGKLTQTKISNAISFMKFCKKISISFLNLFKNFKKFSFNEFFSVVETSGIYATPIISLLAFLIGIVISYQMSLQLKMYGADLYIAQFAGIIILREFGPLIAALIVAGRTSSSFTALIGSMLINEELDALKTMGISFYDRIIVPRILAMLIVLPLLTLISMFAGIIGSMVTAYFSLGIEFTHFIAKFYESVSVNHYLVGMIKSPVFALIITVVGCFQGSIVQKSTVSVSQNTTKSVVQALFLIIIADAFFSITLSGVK